VEHDQVGLGRRDLVDGLPSRGGQRDLEAQVAQGDVEEEPDVLLIVHDQQARCSHAESVPEVPGSPL
jgi:hypothetical protein